jgi:hypothetical protein
VIATQQDNGGNRGESVTASIIHGNRAGDAARQPDGMGINTMLGTGGGVNDLERVAKLTCAGGRERGAPLGAEAWPVIMALGRAPAGAPPRGLCAVGWLGTWSSRFVMVF